MKKLVPHFRRSELYFEWGRKARREGGGAIFPARRAPYFTFEHDEPYERASPTTPRPQEGAGKHYSYDRCRYLINAVSFMKAFITPEASKPWERKAAARSSAVAVS